MFEHINSRFGVTILLILLFAEHKNNEKEKKNHNITSNLQRHLGIHLRFTISIQIIIDSIVVFIGIGIVGTIPFGWFVGAAALMVARGDFLAPMAVVGGAIFAEVAGVGATVMTGGFLAGYVGIHPGWRRFGAASRVCRGFRRSSRGG